MGVRPTSYGTVADIEALERRYTDEGSFTTSTKPTLAQVEGWIDLVSATLNTLLAQAGFSIPVRQADARLALSQFVIAEVADLVEASYGSGRFFSEEAQELGSPLSIITKEGAQFVGEHAQGLEDLGATRNRDLATAWMGAKPISSEVA